MTNLGGRLHRLLPLGVFILIRVIAAAVTRQGSPCTWAELILTVEPGLLYEFRLVLHSDIITLVKRSIALPYLRDIKDVRISSGQVRQSANDEGTLPLLEELIASELLRAGWLD